MFSCPCCVVLINAAVVNPVSLGAQVCSIELIASENFASVPVLEALGSVMTNK